MPLPQPDTNDGTQSKDGGVSDGEASTMLRGATESTGNVRRLGKGMSGKLRSVGGAVASPIALDDAFDKIGKAYQTQNAADVNDAIGGSAGALGTTIGTGQVMLETGAKSISYFQAQLATQAAMGARGAGVKNVGGGLMLETAAPTGMKDATKAAVNAVDPNATRQVRRSTARKAAFDSAKNSGVDRKAARKLATTVAGPAADAAASGLGKAAGRFVPGLNIAIAGFDAVQAATITADDNASYLKKGAAWATAGASGLAATNIPIVSQVGAGVSLITGLVRDLND